MSRRTSESNKAITTAWENEQILVNEGKGTRDWTPEQQRDILERGKAYDNDGKAFRGHHMRSVSICPEEQGNPYNIQFLSHEEHIEAHVICWQPTNWYYDPVTRKKIDFGDGPIIPCKVIELSNPVSLSCVQHHKSINTVHSAAHSGRWCGGPAAAVRFKQRPKLVSYIRFNHHGVVLCCTL